jgi:multidrug efflux pump subunit AcrA (membrane-fusion protein)
MSADTAAHTAEFENAERGEYLKGEYPESAGLLTPDSRLNSPEPKTRAPGRQRVLLWVAVAAALLSTGGLVASTLVKSPAEQAAEAAAPAPSVLTAPVENRVLANTVVTRGTVAASAQYQVTPAGATQGANTPVVTAVRTKVGARVEPGSVLLEVSGRPLIVLQGAVPAYRDLKPNDDGDDVAQLQNALKQLGHYQGGDPAGHFGQATKAAVIALYQSLGYDAPTTGGPGDEGDRSALQSAQDAVDSAQRAVDDMKRQIAAGGAAGGGSQSSAKQTSPSGSGTPSATPGSGGSGGTGSEPLPVQLQYLEKALQQAQQAQSELIARTGPMLPAAEAAFLPGFPAQVVAFSARVGDQVKAPLITLASGQLAVTAQLTTDQGGLLKPGMRVQITAETLGLEATGVIGTVGQVTTGSGGGSGPSSSGSSDGGGSGQTQSGAPYIPVTVTPDSPLDSRWEGQDVRLTVTSASTPGPVLVVPLSAVTSGADGKTTVSILQPDGHSTTRVEVDAGISGDGFVAVAPTVAGSLRAGQRVVVGAQSGTGLS